MCLVMSSRHVAGIKYSHIIREKRESNVCSVENKHYFNSVGVVTEGGRAKMRSKPTGAERRRKYSPNPFVN